MLKTGLRSSHRQASEELFDGLFRDIVGQIAEEGGVGGAARQTRAVDVWLPGCTRSRGQDGAIDGWGTIRILRGVPGSGHCRERDRQECVRKGHNNPDKCKNSMK